MFDRFSETARRSLFFARYEASKLGSDVIETKHILLGILREHAETVQLILHDLDVTPEAIRQMIEGDRLFVDRIKSSAELPLSEEALKVLAHASHEAESLEHSLVNPEHLLLGVANVESGMAVLSAHGITLERLRECVRFRFVARPAPVRPDAASGLTLAGPLAEWIDDLRSAIHARSGQSISRETIVYALLEGIRASELDLRETTNVAALVTTIMDALRRRDE